MVTSLDLRRRLMHTAGVVAGCSVLALSEALNVYAMRRGIYVSRQSPRPSAVAMTWPSWLLMALTAPAIVWLVRRYAFAGRNWVRSAVVHSGRYVYGRAGAGIEALGRSWRQGRR